MRVLVLGGSGYLGQHLVDALTKSRDDEVVWTCCTAPPRDARCVHCDITSLASVEQVFNTSGPFGAVVNTVAISQPGQCQQDPDRARAVNVPTALLRALTQFRDRGPADGSAAQPLLIHISTDQVYSGEERLSAERACPAPVNVYGETKLAAERAVQAAWPRHVILRSSIIYGPQTPQPVSRALFVQFVVEQLRKGSGCKFFTDEYRSPIAVCDIVRIVGFLISDSPAAARLQGQVFNMGGPERLSRWDMAAAVARHCGLQLSETQAAPSASVQRAVTSPLDISMDVSFLQSALPFQLTPFADGLAAVLGPSIVAAGHTTHV